MIEGNADVFFLKLILNLSSFCIEICTPDMPDRAKVYNLPEADSDERLLTEEKADVRADPIDAGNEVELCEIPKELKRPNEPKLPKEQKTGKVSVQSGDPQEQKLPKEKKRPKERQAGKENVTKAHQKKKERKRSMIPDDLAMATSTEVDNAPKRFYLDPQSRFRHRWDIIMLYLLLFTAVVTPFEVSILELQSETAEFWTMIFINFIVNLLFIVDMVRPIRFFTWGCRQ